jgi:adenine-specific DNA-methyltransferase
LLYFSHILTAATIENNVVPSFDKLKEIGINDPFTYLETHDISNVDGFATQEYSPAGEAGRMYLTIESAKRIDFIRTTIETWKDNGCIDTYEYKYLIAALIEGIPYVSNITGTYGAFLKSWDKRAFRRFELIKLSVVDNNQRNICYNQDANELIKKISGDILYIDPPYNERQYLPNYHLVETIAKYDNPQIHGVTGMRDYENKKSSFCNAKKALADLEVIASEAKFKYLVMSYNSEGIMPQNEILAMLSKYGEVKVEQFEYARFKSNNKGASKTKRTVYEQLYILKK